jgi:hypothetical protein
MNVRFRDPLVWVEDFAREDIHVVCPRCAARAVNTPRRTDSPRFASWPRRLTCVGCGYSAAWTSGDTVWDGGEDPYFHLPLWLRAECCGGHLLWAFNEHHLATLEGYVAARLRERRASPGAMTMLARLPRWLTSAKNRDEVLRTIGRLRGSLIS